MGFLVPLVIVNVALLRIVGVPLGQQILLALLTSAFVVCGIHPSRSIGDFLPDRVAALLVAYLISLSVVMPVTFLLFHRPFVRLVQPDEGRFVFIVVDLLYFALAAAAWRRARSGEASATPTVRSRWAFAVLLTLALAMAAFTYYGKLNRYLGESISIWGFELSEWGQHADATRHLVEIPELMMSEGFPPERLAHRGLELLLVQQAQVTGRGSLAESVIDTAKVLAPLFYFALAYLVFGLAMELGVSERSALLASVCALLFGPMSLHPLSADFTSYSGNFPVAGTLYHNATQLFSLPFALAGTLFVASSLNQRVDRRFVAGCVLIAVSFFIKPSAFSVLAPAIFFILPLTRPAERRSALAGAAVLVAVPVVWWGYARLLGLSTAADQVGTVFTPLRSKFLVGRHTAPVFLQDHPVLWAMTILLLSFGAFVPVALTVARLTVRAARSSEGLIPAFRRRRREIFLALPALLGVGGAALFSAEQRGFSNLNWGAAAGVMIALPVFFWSVERLLSRPARRLVLVLVAIHLWGGAQHLARFVETGEVVVRDHTGTPTSSRLPQSGPPSQLNLLPNDSVLSTGGYQPWGAYSEV